MFSRLRKPLVFNLWCAKHKERRSMRTRAHMLVVSSGMQGTMSPITISSDESPPWYWCESLVSAIGKWYKTTGNQNDNNNDNDRGSDWSEHSLFSDSLTCKCRYAPPFHCMKPLFCLWVHPFTWIRKSRFSWSPCQFLNLTASSDIA